MRSTVTARGTLLACAALVLGIVVAPGCGVGRVSDAAPVAAPSASAAGTTGTPPPSISPTERPVDARPSRPAPVADVTGTTASVTTTTSSTLAPETTPSMTTQAPGPGTARTPAVVGRDYSFPAQSDSCWYPSSHHDYPAADIFCPVGTPFVAVVGGTVDFVSREDLYAQGFTDAVNKGGLSVAIVGDDGWRYYGSHLSTVADGIEPGVRVEVGQLLGLTGDTGNAAGTDPHVHFGISRPTSPDDWQVRRGHVWPQDYLAAWRRGEDISPAA